MLINLVLPVSIVLGLITYGLIARWYVTPWLDRQPWDRAMVPLLLLHCFRFVGLSFLIPGVVSANLSPAFALPAALGDLAAALLAFLAVFAVRRRWALAATLVWIFSAVGTLDLVNAIVQRLRHVEMGQLGAAYYIPVVVVPALLVSHYLIFKLLVRQEAAAGISVDRQYQAETQA